MDIKPDATETPKATIRPVTEIPVSELVRHMEAIAESLNAIEARQERHEEALEEVKADTEEILNNLDNIAFKADYPGLEE